MAREAWVPVGNQWCDKMQAEASMVEHRVYPVEVMPDYPGYKILARKCSLAIACNLAGYPCKWAYIEPSVDPFKPTV